MGEIVRQWLQHYPPGKIGTLASIYPEKLHFKHPIGANRVVQNRRSKPRQRRFDINFSNSQELKNAVAT